MTDKMLKQLEEDAQKAQDRIEKANRIKKDIAFAKSRLDVFKEFEENPELIFTCDRDTPAGCVSERMKALFNFSFDEHRHLSEVLFNEVAQDDFATEKRETIKFMAHLFEKRIATLKEEFAQM